MSAVARALRAFASFWFDFIVGDDWTVAAAVTAALFGTWGLTHTVLPAWWLLPAVVLAVTTASLHRSVARDRRRDEQGR